MALRRTIGADAAADGVRGKNVIGGERVHRDRVIDVFNPYTEQLIGTVPKATLEDVKRAFRVAKAYRSKLTRFERAAILNKAAAIIRSRTDEYSDLITAESGLCKKDSLYEIGRVSDVLLFGASECLKDDGQIFSCDLTSITPRNHPMNQIAHKIVPSIVTNNRMVPKPSEKVPFSAIVLAAFTGGVAIGKYIASKAGYRRMVLELGGNKNSGQRCTAIKRILVQRAGRRPLRRDADREDDSLERYGDPMDGKLDMGTVIDEAAARYCEDKASPNSRSAR